MKGEGLRKDTESEDEDSEGEKGPSRSDGMPHGWRVSAFFLNDVIFLPPPFFCGIIVKLAAAVNLVVCHPTSAGTIRGLFGGRGTIVRLVTAPKTF